MDVDTRTIAQRYYRRNLTLGLVNGGLFGFVDSIVSPYLVLSLFVNQLGGSNLLVGLLPAIANGGWFLPQFLISHRLQRLPFKKPVYIGAAIVRIVCWFFLPIVTFVIGGSNPALLLVAFFLLYSIYCFAAGFAGTPFMDIVAKTIPVERRGSYFGQRDLAGALMAIGAGYLVNTFLDPHIALKFPNNYAVLFSIAFIVVTVALVAFMFVVEPREQVYPREITLREQTHAARHMVRENHIYRRYLLTRIVLAAADVATPFYAIFATRILQALPEIVGAYIGISMVASLVTNPLLSRLSDRRGHRIVLNIAASGMLVMPLIALAFTSFSPGPALGLPFGILFVVNGVSRTAANIAFPSYLLEIAPAGERPLYVGFTNTVLGVATFIPVIGGILLDAAGFGVVLWLTLAISALGVWLARGMVEPRKVKLNSQASNF